MRMHLVAATVAAGLAASIAGTAPATADVFKIDQFTVVKTRTDLRINGTTTTTTAALVDDTFDDGLPPPETQPGAGVFTYGNCVSSTDCYDTNGTFTEANSRAVLDTSLGDPFTIPPSTPTLLESATLETNIQPGNFHGLRQGNSLHSNTFNVTGRFDLGLPSSPGTKYGVALTDRLIGGTGTPPDQLGNDTLTMAVNNDGGTVRVEFNKNDFQNGFNVQIASVDLQPILDSLALSSVTPDQIVLELARNDSATNDITGSFSLLQAGVDVYDQTLLTPLQLAADATVFNGEDWTRPAFYALQTAVPEPMSLVLFGFGLAGLGFVRRRRAA